VSRSGQESWPVAPPFAPFEECGLSDLLEWQSTRRLVICNPRQLNRSSEAIPVQYFAGNWFRQFFSDVDDRMRRRQPTVALTFFLAVRLKQRKSPSPSGEQRAE